MPLLKEALKSPRLVRGRSCSLCAGRQVKGAVGKTRHAATGHIRRRRTCPECGRSYFTVELRLPDAAKAIRAFGAAIKALPPDVLNRLRKQ